MFEINFYNILQPAHPIVLFYRLTVRWIADETLAYQHFQIDLII